MPSGNSPLRTLLIAGATASGKSSLALDLAERISGEIVGADSMQIYRDLRVLTARPTAEEEARVPHHLVGTVDAAEAWSVGRWLEEALAAIADIQARGRTPIVVGGTGLYFRALTQGLAEIPPVPEEARAVSQLRYEALGEAEFRAVLARLDPESAARITPGDRQRLVRAHAVAVHTGAPLGYWQAATRPALQPGSWSALVVEPEREALYARCDGRLEAMVKSGALEETAALMARELSVDLPVMKAVAFRELADHLAGRTSLAEAVTLAQQMTRNYAKRQLTWFRNQTPDWRRVAGPDLYATLAALED